MMAGIDGIIIGNRTGQKFMVHWDEQNKVLSIVGPEQAPPGIAGSAWILPGTGVRGPAGKTP